MHEVSIIMNVVSAVEDEARKHNATVVEHIVLEVGDLAGVDIHALEFAWEPCVKNTILEHAARSITKMEGWAFCTRCRCEFNVQTIFDPCPLCKEHVTRIIRGTELKIRSITLLN